MKTTKKMVKMVWCALAAACALAAPAEESAPKAKIKAIYTVPHELDCLLESGHVQGMCCSEKAIYLSHQLGIEKLGWDGRLVKRLSVPAHLGDVAYAGGRIYGAFVIRDKALRSEGRQGLVRVWDEDLNQLAEAWFDEPLDGIAVLGKTVYVGVDKWGRPAHALCAVKRLGLDLAPLGNATVNLGFKIHYGVQTMATDGKSLFFGLYGAPAEEGNQKRYTCARLTPGLKVMACLTLGCSEGFCRVPKSVAKRETPVFLAVHALGGNMQGWREDPANNPPRVRLDFYEFADGDFRNITTMGE